MDNLLQGLSKNGFAIVNDIYSDQEIEEFISLIEKADNQKNTFRISKNLFAIRQFLKEIPAAISLIFNNRFKKLISSIGGPEYFIVKSIYFDKPPESNWFVAYHQDLTISVTEKIEIEEFGPWTIKQNQFAVQPPKHILQNIFTMRIHLDDTNKENGALKVIPQSHLNGIIKATDLKEGIKNEMTCCVNKGGVIVMKPLVFHASSRTTNNKRRRVIHLEFSNMILPKGLCWSEKIVFT